MGFDIGCGNMAVRLDTPYVDIAGRVPDMLAETRKAISFGVGRSNQERVEHELFDDTGAWHASGMGDYRQKAMAQLGTVGAGNHDADLMCDEAGFVWIGCTSEATDLGIPAPRAN